MWDRSLATISTTDLLRKLNLKSNIDMNTKMIIGIILIILGICAGLYFGLWWAFIGGIVAVIEQIRADEMSSMVIALGVARVFFAGFIGWIAAFLFIRPGLAFFE